MAATQTGGLASRHGDVGIVLLVLGVLVVLFTPISPGLLDVLILANFAGALLILLLTFYVPRPVEFSTFPSLLLIATLMRLALNVAATRLILSDADAGRVIAAIGGHVVGGNFVIGLIVFVILVVVQYVVVTNGAQRVSEVAARFTLDSMPGQQMSIDADLNMGFIDQAEAQRRRSELEREAAFYGAMDGASKFVKGDAIAGILILVVNIVGGISIGVLQNGMDWREALQTYTLLTIGDGIVTQVPALVIAVATGIIVTRSAADGSFGREALRQVTAFPKALILLGVALVALAALPGIPLAAALLVLALVSVAAVLAWRASSRVEGPAASPSLAAGKDDAAPDDADPYVALAFDPIEIHLGRAWAAQASTDASAIPVRIAAFRRHFALDAGLVLPPVRFRDSERLAPLEYEVHIDGVPLARGESRDDRLLAIHPTGDLRFIPGEPTRDPSYGLPALWIEPRLREAALAARCTVVDGATVLMTHVTEVLRRESSSLMTRAQAERMLERVRRTQPTLVEELVPALLSVSDVQRVLQGLLREKVSVRHLEAILETLADAGRQTKDVAQLVERVRQRLGASICQPLLGEGRTLQVLTLGAEMESLLLQALTPVDGRSPSGLDPRLAEQMLSRLAQLAERMMKSNLLPVLLCAPDLRRQIRMLSERMLPHLRVLSMAEVPATVELRSFGVVGAAAGQGGGS